MYDAIDVMGFAGGMTLGVVNAGFHLVGKRELKGGFGVPNCEANRHLLGYDWDTEIGPSEEWTAKTVPFVFGNPPCSGFSVMTDRRFRGIDAKVNACMWELMSYAGRCRPQVVVMESVRPAFTRGAEMMRGLRARLEERSGLSYDLYHVMQDAYILGGAALRPRYFLVASRVPFGVDWPAVRQPLLRDVWGDLDGLSITWQRQPYRRPPTWWSSRPRLNSDGVDGHATINTPYIRRALDLLENNGGWPEGWHIGKVAREHYRQAGSLPASWDTWRERLLTSDFHMGYTSMTRWVADRPARVITGGALGLVLHPWENRTITHREAARVMGFPDDWLILPIRGKSGLQMTWGKGITVQCGEWVGHWVREALDGRPGPVVGDKIGDRERVIWPPKVRTSHSRGRPGMIVSTGS